MWQCFRILVINVIVAVNIQSVHNYQSEIEEMKSAYKSGSLQDMSEPITLDVVKVKLKDHGIFDWQEPSLSKRERDELKTLFDEIEIMTTSRARQPSQAQNVISPLQLVESVLKKLLKQGTVSEALGSKFQWEKLRGPAKRSMGRQAHITLFNNNKDF